jgi:tRNA(fMet)-specific endonuclease VapC
MKFLLDTNTCIRYLNGRSASVADRMNSLNEHDAAVCSIVRAEMLYGALRSQDPVKTTAFQERFLGLFVSLPFDDAAANHYARIRAKLAVQGTPIGANDLIIAAIAIANDLVLVTHNTREFVRVEGLKTEDWEKEDRS